VVVEVDLDLDCRIASRVEDLPGHDDVDGRHERLLMSELMSLCVRFCLRAASAL
jgi:hypothetical protein